MFDWIFEADVYRLKKAASDATTVCERRELEALPERKLVILSQLREHRPRGQSQMPDRSRGTDVEYHLRRARSERDIAYRSADGLVADPHMRLSALHLHRALLLEAVNRAAVGNIHPLRAVTNNECRPVPVSILSVINLSGRSEK